MVVALTLREGGAMPRTKFDYVIVGGGLAGISAVEGIRERDKNGTVLVLSQEAHPPYHRPPLTKKLWSGEKKVEEIYVHDRSFYETQGVQINLSSLVTSITRRDQSVSDVNGSVYHYGKLLLATGGIPRRLNIPGAELEGIYYYRYLDDFLKLRAAATEGKTAVVIGGGFIGSELAASLSINNVAVTMIFPDAFLGARIFPAPLADAITQHYREHDIRILAPDTPVAFERRANKFVTHTRQGSSIESDIVVVGVGIWPSANLASGAGLVTNNGIAVNEYLQTSVPNIFAAGDNASFPYQALGQKTRVEHWDNALNQGKCAGRNMVDRDAPYVYMPYFFSDLFSFGYEAVGEISARMETVADWTVQNETGTIYYLRDHRVRGVMMCNVWNKMDQARDMIRRQEPLTESELRHAI